MSRGTFYLLPETDDAGSEAVHRLACKLAEHHYRQKLTVYVHCGSRTQAFAIDETLWQFEPESFVPHNLKGEGLGAGSPVEIGFDQTGPATGRQLLINLAEHVPGFAAGFGNIIDFVPADEALKAVARDRFRQYKALGISLSTANSDSLPL